MNRSSLTLLSKDGLKCERMSTNTSDSPLRKQGRFLPTPSYCPPLLLVSLGLMIKSTTGLASKRALVYSPTLPPSLFPSLMRNKMYHLLWVQLQKKEATDRLPNAFYHRPPLDLFKFPFLGLFYSIRLRHAFIPSFVTLAISLLSP